MLIKLIQRLFVVFVIATLQACSGGGGGLTGSVSSAGDSATGGAGSEGGSVSALTVPEQMSVVSTTESGSASLSALRLGFALSDFPTTSQYYTDETFTFVEERSGDAFNIINEILCMLDQTAYEEMIAQGDYIAQIDFSLCESDSDDPAAAAQASSDESSGGSQPDYEYWTANSYRESDSSPHVVALWGPMEGDEGMPNMDLEAELVITEGKSTANPFGIFQMNFKAVPNYDGYDETSTASFQASGDDMFLRGFLRTEEQDDGTILLQFYAGNGGNSDFNFEQKVAKVESTDGLSGAGSMTESSHDGEFSFDETFDVAFNADYFLRSDSSNNQVCLHRGSTDSTVHRYNLYQDNTGDRVELASGFPFRIAQDDGRDIHGWIGHWGLGVPPGVTLNDGDAVVRDEFNQNGQVSNETFSLMIAKGKLRKHSRNTTTMGDLAGVPIQTWDCDETSCSDFQVEWDSATEKLMKVRTMDHDNYLWTEQTPEEFTFGDNEYHFNGYSPSTGGSIQVSVRDSNTGEVTAITNETTVVFYSETTVEPGDDGIPEDLICFQDCPDPANIDGDPMNWETSFEQSTWAAEGQNSSYSQLANTMAPADLVPGTHYLVYSFDESEMMLSISGQEVHTTANSVASQGMGVWSGPMMTTDQLENLACQWNTEQTCAWDAWQLDVFYTWETGENSWNQLALLVDSSGSIVQFDEPLFVKYTHSNGVKYFLDYNGSGQLNGIPGKCVDMDTGSEVSCHEAQDNYSIRWVNQFNIPNGSALIDVDSNETYYSKAIDIEQRMQAAPMSDCSSAGLSLARATLPSEDDWSEPVIGDEPDLGDEPPSVIAGVVQ